MGGYIGDLINDNDNTFYFNGNNILASFLEG